MSILDRFKLDGKLAVVTGCRRGIGKGLAVALAEAGADIVGVSKSLEPGGSEVEKAVVQAGRKFYPYQCDFRKRQAVHDFTARVLRISPSSIFWLPTPEPPNDRLLPSIRTNSGTR